MLQARGRHDPCVLPRAVPMVEAMAALVLADHALRQDAVRAGAPPRGTDGAPTRRAILAPLRGLGRERLGFLSLVTGGHALIHWFQQMFAVVLPSVTQGLGLTEIQVGYLQSARQLTSGTMNLPVGLLADSFARWQAAILASALLFMGVGYFCLGRPGESAARSSAPPWSASAPRPGIRPPWARSRCASRSAGQRPSRSTAWAPRSRTRSPRSLSARSS